MTKKMPPWTPDAGYLMRTPLKNIPQVHYALATIIKGYGITAGHKCGTCTHFVANYQSYDGSCMRFKRGGWQAGWPACGRWEQRP